MSLGMSLNQQLNPRLELEQHVEEKLGQKTENKCEQTLRQCLELEPHIIGLIRWVNEHNCWKSFSKFGFDFKYGLIPSSKSPFGKHMAGFSHCMYNVVDLFLGGRGTWYLFVVEDITPKEYQEFVALHERGEELSLGDHYWANKLEFAGVKKSRKTGDYIKWIDAEYPTKFVDLTIGGCTLLPDDLRKELEQKNQENKEIYTAQDLIDQHPLPTKIMKLALKYRGINEKVEEQLIEVVGPAQFAIHTAQTIDEAVVGINKTISSVVQKILEKQLRILVPQRIHDSLARHFQMVDEFFYKATNKKLSMSYDIHELYQAVKEGKPIIQVTS